MPVTSKPQYFGCICERSRQQGEVCAFPTAAEYSILYIGNYRDFLLVTIMQVIFPGEQVVEGHKQDLTSGYA